MEAQPRTQESVGGCLSLSESVPFPRFALLKHISHSLLFDLRLFIFIFSPYSRLLRCLLLLSYSTSLVALRSFFWSVICTRPLLHTVLGHIDHPPLATIILPISPWLTSPLEAGQVQAVASQQSRYIIHAARVIFRKSSPITNQVRLSSHKLSLQEHHMAHLTLASAYHHPSYLIFPSR